MHSPPNDLEKHEYLKTDRRKFYFLGISSLLILFVGMTFFVLTNAYLYVLIPLYASLFLYLIISYVIGVFGRDFDFKSHIEHRQNAVYTPTVDIYLPTCGEPVEIIQKTFEHVARLMDGYKNAEAFALDDKGDPQIESLCRNYGFHYISRPNKGEFKKAGNLRYAFERTKGEFIAIFDADFCPRSDYFRELLHYFIDEKVGIIQTPQYFTPGECKNWIDRGSAIVQILFYKLIQTNRDKWNASICVGTNAIYRRSMLKPFGGTALIGYSEDLHTGFNCHRSGFTLKYVPLNLAKGLCPDTMAQFFNQQYRWCMGSFTLFLNREFWKCQMPFMMRISYLSGMMYYMATALSIFLNPIPSLIMIYAFPEHIIWYSIFFSVPSLLFGTIFFAYWTKHWNILDVILSRQFSYYAYLFAIKDKLFGSLMEWIPTGSSNQSFGRLIKAKRYLYWWNFTTMFLITFGYGYHINVIGIQGLLTLALSIFWFTCSILVLSKTSL